jgi:hypothetical protein
MTTAIECPTIKRLRALRPGESLVYYRGGKFAQDIRSRVPVYANLLARIERTAAELQILGRVTLSERESTIISINGNELTVIEHIATGRGGNAAT